MHVDFYNAPSHKKIVDNPLNVEKMNASSGGKQPVMRDTVWNGNVQRMVLDYGRPKWKENSSRRKMC